MFHASLGGKNPLFYPPTKTFTDTTARTYTDGKSCVNLLGGAFKYIQVEYQNTEVLFMYMLSNKNLYFAFTWSYHRISSLLRWSQVAEFIYFA